ncbi:MAG: hypothetical protein JW934_20865 [Anaerolineae bacterium]|nr:hypothetical protein [Anaerolineae bacterium]
MSSRGQPTRITLTFYEGDQAILDWLNAQRQAKTIALRRALGAFVAGLPESTLPADAKDQLQAVTGQIAQMGAQVEALDRHIRTIRTDEARQIGRIAAELRQELNGLSDRLRQDALDHVIGKYEGQAQAREKEPLLSRLLGR